MHKISHLSDQSSSAMRASDKEKQGYIQDLRKLSKIELLDLKQRQEQLLRNKSRLSKLPDKGAKIQRFYDEILKHLQAQNNMDRAAQLFSDLNIAAVGKKSVSTMEWNGRNDPATVEDSAPLDSDDDPDEQKPDVLKILAQSTATEKKIVRVKEEPKLITEQDLQDIKELSELQTGHVVHLCHKERNSPAKERFMPFRTTTSNVHSPEKERQRHLQHLKRWDNTAATPPALVHVPAKLMSLEESMLLQAKQRKLLEEAKEQQAQERLKQRDAIRERVADNFKGDTVVVPGAAGFSQYRGAPDSDAESDETATSDEEDDDVEDFQGEE